MLVLALFACSGGGSGDDSSGTKDDRLICDVPQLFETGCAGSGCHNATDEAGGLDLISTGVDDRVSQQFATQCYGYLADPSNPEESILYTKVHPDNDCGSNMPIGSDPWGDDDLACLLGWIEGLQPPPPDTGEYCANCECEPEDTQSCYTGSSGTEDVGICLSGTQTCSWKGEWGDCEGEVLPSVEDCTTKDVDENCDGATPACSEVWSAAFGNDMSQALRSVAVDSKGNVYVLGDFEGTVDFGTGPFKSDNDNHDIVLAKFDLFGNPVWADYWGDSSNQYATKLIVDQDDNLLLLGRAFGKIDFGGGELDAEGTDDIFVVKLDSNGGHLWSRIFGGVDPDRAERFTTDSEGNVLVTGTFTGEVDFGWGPVTSNGARDAFVLKLDAKYGSHIWSQRIGGKGDEYGFGIDTDIDDNVYVTGRFQESLTFQETTVSSVGDYDVYMAKLDSGGTLDWFNTFGSKGEELAQDLLITTAGPQEVIALLGHSSETVDFGGGDRTSAGERDIFLASFDLDGQHRWSQLYGDKVDQFDTSYDVNTWLNLDKDSSGNIWMGGTYSGSIDFGPSTLTYAGNVDMLMFGVDTDGKFISGQRYGGSYTDILLDQHIVGDDFVVFVGRFFSTGGIDFGAAGAVTGAGSADGVVVKLPL